MARPVLAAAVLLAAAALAGCAEEPAPILAVKATATNGLFMSPLAYDGSALAFAGDAMVDVDAVANTGSVRVSGTVGNDTYEVAWTQFAADPTKPFQDGGVATDFLEHGATGVGDDSIPAVHLIGAGWGTATVTKNGQPYKDPVTGLDGWVAHFMLTDTGVFHPDKTVKTTAGGVYTPAQAATGATEPGDLELHVALKNNPGPAANVTPIEVTGQAQGQSEATLTAEVPESATLDAEIFVRPQQAAVPPLSQMTLVLTDPAGAEVATLTSQPGQPASQTVSVADPLPGTYTLTASGTGANAVFGMTLTPTPPTAKQLYFVFEDVTLG